MSIRILKGTRERGGWQYLARDRGEFITLCLRVAHEYARLAGLTKQRNVQDQLLDLARGWTAIARHERRSDGARVLRFTTATTSPERPRSKRQLRPSN
jgi:hypothetical protein